VLVVPPALADTKSQLDEAKRELAAVQSQLNEAAARWQAAESRLEQTQDEVADAKARMEQIQASIDRIQERLQRRAVLAFQSGPASTIDLLLSSSSFAEFSDRLEFLGSMAQADSDLLVEQDVATEQLQRARADLLVLSERQAATAAELQAAAAAIQDRLAAVQARVSDLTAKYNAEQAAARQLQILGQTPVPGAPLQVCPVAGPNSFVDSFGWPRSGGRSHQGTDLIAASGTPVVAAHPGVVSRSSSSLGGIQAYVRAPSGTYTFYAHLSGYSSASGSVGAGTVIGYVGSTGNAGSVNHLHFEYHPGGGAAIDPYPYLLAVC